MSAATASGSSAIGMWPQPGSAPSLTSAGNWSSRRDPRSSSRSRDPNATVTGALIACPARNGAVVVPRIAASKPGQVAIALMLALARPGDIRTGRPWVWPSMTTRPARYPASRYSSPSACSHSQRVARRLTRSYSGMRPGHRPAGESRVTEAGALMRASSSATQPPSELPARCGAARPSSAVSPATAAASWLGLTTAFSQRWRVAEARQVDGDDLETLRQERDDRVPGVPPGSEPVQQHERLAAACSGVGECRHVDLSLFVV